MIISCLTIIINCNNGSWFNDAWLRTLNDDSFNFEWSVRQCILTYGYSGGPQAIGWWWLKIVIIVYSNCESTCSTGGFPIQPLVRCTHVSLVCWSVISTHSLIGIISGNVPLEHHTTKGSKHPRIRNDLYPQGWWNWRLNWNISLLHAFGETTWVTTFLLVTPFQANPSLAPPSCFQSTIMIGS